MLKTQIKASQITNLTDARYFAAWGIDWMGFDMDQGSEHFLPPANLLAIKEWVEGPKMIGEYGLQQTSSLLDSANQLGLDGVQIGPFFPTEELANLKPLLIFQKLVIDAETSNVDIQQSLQEKGQYVDLFILDFASNGISWSELKGNHSPISISQLQNWAKDYPLLLDISFAAQHAHELLELGIRGFSVKGGAEEKVGFKSYDDLDDLFEAIEQE